MLQLCEYMYKPIDSGLKVTIKMPSLQIPAQEQQLELQEQVNGTIAEEPKEIEQSVQKPATILRISVPKRPVPSPLEEVKEREGKRIYIYMYKKKEE